MGNVDNKNQSGFRGEKVVSAKLLERPKEGCSKILEVANHEGVQVTTDKGNKYLIHSTPKSGTVVTDCKLSKNWTVKGDIPVQGTKTVGEVFNQASGRTNNKLTNYVTSGTCINTARNAEKALKK